jgi:hypothetical protein
MQPIYSNQPASRKLSFQIMKKTGNTAKIAAVSGCNAALKQKMSLNSSDSPERNVLKEWCGYDGSHG